MNLKSPDEIIAIFVEKYLTKEDNIINAKRLFVASSVIRWIFETTTNQTEIIQYLGQVEKYLNGQIELYWHNDVIKVGRAKKGKS